MLLPPGEQLLYLSGKEFSIVIQNLRKKSEIATKF